MELKGTVALITGGGTGVGRATALLLANHGVHIAVNYSRSADEANQTVAELQKRGVSAIACKADVAIDQEAREMVARVIQEFGRLDILINNAGKTHYVDLPDLEAMREDLWDDIFAVNVKGAFFVSRAAASELQKTRGCIVNISSIAGITGRGSSIAYAASKAALLNITRSLAVALAPDVRVNAVAPGIVITRWVDGHEDHVERLSRGCPMQRSAQPEDIAEVALSLVDRATHVTGQTWVVDGGMTMR